MTNIISSSSNSDINSTIDRYVSQFDDTQNQSIRSETTAQSGDKELVKDFYAVATDFYEHGWRDASFRCLQA